MSAPDRVEGLSPAIDDVQEAYRGALRNYHNWNDWEDEQYEAIEKALRKADTCFRNGNGLIRDLIAELTSAAQDYETLVDMGRVSGPVAATMRRCAQHWRKLIASAEDRE